MTPTLPTVIALLFLAVPAPFAHSPDDEERGSPAPRTETVRFTSGDVALAGLLRLPENPAPRPAVVLLPGSLATAKEDERLTEVTAAFVEQGFAALTTDSRGTGDSEGNFDTASFEVLAGDAAAAVRMLRERPEVRAEAVGLWGVSQGGTWVGPLAAHRADAAFLVAASGPLVSPEDSMHRLLAANLRGRQELGEAAIARITATRRAIWHYYATGTGHEEAQAALRAVRDEPWFGSSGLPDSLRSPSELASLPARTRTFLGQKSFEPLAALARIPCPVLVVYGARDGRMPVAEHAESLRSLSARAEAPIRVEVLPGLDHDLRPVTADDPDGSSPPDPYTLMARWARARVERTAPAP